MPAGITPSEFLRARGGARPRGAAVGAGDAARRSRGVPRSAWRTELDVICQMGFAGYFLIVWDFIRWARENGIPVGPGPRLGRRLARRLRAAASPTSIRSRYNLLFERFLNPERVSMPDFDVDFCMDGRDEVIDYVAEQVRPASASGRSSPTARWRPRRVVRDVGRVLGMPTAIVDRDRQARSRASSGITLDEALENEPELKRAVRRATTRSRNLLDLARTLEGLTRHAGKHAAGVVIATARC